MNRNHHHPDSTEKLFQYDNLLEFEFGKDCTAECLKEVVESLEMYKTASILYQSLKVNEDGSLPLFQFRDVLFTSRQKYSRSLYHQYFGPQFSWYQKKNNKFKKPFLMYLKLP
ncbi:hypothetical protein ACTFIY_011300 [Dictyostelium cf. discoideum]